VKIIVDDENIMSIIDKELAEDAVKMLEAGSKI